MKIADLFVNLGVKGTDTSAKALGGVKSGLGEVKSMGLETKAMIAAVVYGLERMMSQSMQSGLNLYNLSQFIDMNTDSLQKWEYAGKQAGVSAGETDANFKALQNTMTNMLLGKGAPEGFSMFAEKTNYDVSRARDLQYTMLKLQEFAKSAPKDVGNAMLRSFGLTEGMITAQRQGVFNDSNFKKAPVYGPGETSALKNADIAWSNLGTKIDMAFGHFTAKHGGTIIDNLSRITGSVLHLVEVLEHLSETFHIFKVIETMTDLIAFSLGEAGKVADKLTLGSKTDNGKSSGTGILNNSLVEVLEHLSGTFPVFKTIETMNDLIALSLGKTDSGKSRGMEVWDNFLEVIKHPPDAKNPYAYAHPVVDARARFQGQGNSQHVEVNQTLQFHHDGKDAKQTGHSVNKAVKDAFRQIPAQGQGP